MREEQTLPEMPETFFERCLDYRSAPVRPDFNWAQKAYEGLEDCVRAYGLACFNAGIAEGGKDAWQPIETAPKDGGMILLCKGRFVVPGWWDESSPRWNWKIVDSIDVDEDDNVMVNGWHASGPTHWMPLPSAPTPPAAMPNKDQK